jgi:cation transport regulator ChaC
VVTLVPNSEWLKLPGADEYPSRLVWGVMYTIDPNHAEEVHAYLDEREKDGYELMDVDVFVIKDGQEQSYGKVCTLTKS